MGRSLVFGLLALAFFLCLLAEAQADGYDYKPVERMPVYKPDEQKKEEEVKKLVYKPEEEKKYKPDFKAKPHYKADDDENEKKYKPGYKYRPHYKADDDDDEDKKKYKPGYKYKPHYKADDDEVEDEKKYKPGYKYKPHYDDEDDEDDEKENKPGYYKYKPHYKAGHEHKAYKYNKDEKDKKYKPQYKAKPVYKADEEKRYRPGYKAEEPKTYKPVYKPVEKPVYKPVEKPVYKPVEKPVYKPAEKPTYEKISVEGYVYCRDRYSKKPVERAVVSLTCTKSKASMEQKTNAYGYFYFPLSYGAYKGIDVSTLKVSLVSSPSKNCNVVTNVNNGKSGAVLDKIKSKIVGETLIYEVGPFAFVPPAPVYDTPKYPYHS